MYDYSTHLMLGSYIPSELMPPEETIDTVDTEPKSTDTQIKRNQRISTLLALFLVLINGTIIATNVVKFAQSESWTPVIQTEGQQQMAQWIADKSL